MKKSRPLPTVGDLQKQIALLQRDIARLKQSQDGLLNSRRKPWFGSLSTQIQRMHQAKIEAVTKEIASLTMDLNELSDIAAQLRLDNDNPLREFLRKEMLRQIKYTSPRYRIGMTAAVGVQEFNRLIGSTPHNASRS